MLDNDEIAQRGGPDEIVITAVSDPSQGGTVRVSDDGTQVIYSSPDGFIGRDSFTYTVTGGYESTVRVNLNEPVRDDAETVLQDGGETVLDVLTNDFLGNGTPDGPRVITSVSAAEHGTVRVSDDGSRLLYTPAEGYIGADDFTYEVNGEAEASVRVGVESRVRDDRFHRELTPSLDPINLSVLENDRFYRDGVSGTITAVTQPASGGIIEIAADGRSLVFTPDEMQSGWTVFTYTVDGAYTADVVVRRDASVRLNTDNGATVRNGEPISIQPLSNDYLGTTDLSPVSYPNSDYPFDGLITSLGQTAAGGTATLQGDGRTVIYTPPADFVGVDSFDYTVDGRFTGTVHVTVNPPLRLNGNHLTVEQNSDPVLVDVLRNDQVWSQPGRRFNVTASDTPYPGTITAVSAAAAGGTVAISADGQTVIYTPPADFDGQDSFTYTVDGEFTETVHINFIRRTRDDRVAVQDDIVPMLLEMLKLVGQSLSLDKSTLDPFAVRQSRDGTQEPRQRPRRRLLHRQSLEGDISPRLAVFQGHGGQKLGHYSTHFEGPRVSCRLQHGRRRHAMVDHGRPCQRSKAPVLRL